MSVLLSPVIQSRWGRAREIGGDLLVATALIWTLPLLLGILGALVKVLRNAT